MRIPQIRTAHLRVSNKHHSVHFISLLPLLVNEGEFYIEPVCDGCHPLGSARVRTDNDGVPPLGYVLLDPLEHRGLRVQIVHGDIEEALDLTNARSITRR